MPRPDDTAFTQGRTPIQRYSRERLRGVLALAVNDRQEAALAALKEDREFFLGEFQFAYVETHCAARNGLVPVRFMEGHNWRVAVNVHKISSRSTFFVFGGAVPKFANYAQQLVPGQMRWELHHRVMRYTLICDFGVRH